LTGRLVDSSTEGGFGGVEHEVSTIAPMPTQQAVCAVVTTLQMGLDVT
jgi:hypothetical protein